MGDGAGGGGDHLQTLEDSNGLDLALLPGKPSFTYLRTSNFSRGCLDGEAGGAFLLRGAHSSLLEGHDFAKNTAVVGVRVVFVLF